MENFPLTSEEWNDIYNRKPILKLVEELPWSFIGLRDVDVCENLIPRPSKHREWTNTNGRK